MKLPKAILFDLDDTILSAYSRPEAAWLAVAEEFALEIGTLAPKELAARVQRHADRFWRNPEDHRVWRQNLGAARREIVSAAMAELDAESCGAFAAEVGMRLADRFTAYRDEKIFVFPGARETIDTLRDAGVRLALVTNGDGPGQRAKLTRFDLAGCFDHIQVEGEAGFGKPDDRAYLHAMETLEVSPGDTWMVGDDLEWEVAAPQRLGIFAIWHDHLGTGVPVGSAVQPDRIIRSLPELLTDV